MFSSVSTQSEACLVFCDSAGDGINTKHIYMPVDQVFPSLESNKIKRSGSTQPLLDGDVFFGVYPIRGLFIFLQQCRRCNKHGASR